MSRCRAPPDKPPSSPSSQATGAFCTPVCPPHLFVPPCSLFPAHLLLGWQSPTDPPQHPGSSTLHPYALQTSKFSDGLLTTHQLVWLTRFVCIQTSLITCQSGFCLCMSLFIAPLTRYPKGAETVLLHILTGFS